MRRGSEENPFPTTINIEWIFIRIYSTKLLHFARKRIKERETEKERKRLREREKN